VWYNERKTKIENMSSSFFLSDPLFLVVAASSMNLMSVLSKYRGFNKNRKRKMYINPILTSTNVAGSVVNLPKLLSE
jgi:hypothetical protein